MTNQIEMNMIKAIDKFIIYMLTENDEEKIIYSKLNELEDEELEEWVNEKLKNYLANGWDYEEGDIIIDNEEIQVWINGDICDIHICDIFNGSCGEILQIQRKIRSFDMEGLMDYYYNEDILKNYYYMYIDEMSPIELKEYIINLLDPVEPK
jgi:hypothetical protein